MALVGWLFSQNEVGHGFFLAVTGSMWKLLGFVAVTGSKWQCRVYIVLKYWKLQQKTQTVQKISHVHWTPQLQCRPHNCHADPITATK